MRLEIAWMWMNVQQARLAALLPRATTQLGLSRVPATQVFTEMGLHAQHAMPALRAAVEIACLTCVWLVPMLERKLPVVRLVQEIRLVVTGRSFAGASQGTKGMEIQLTTGFSDILIARARMRMSVRPTCTTVTRLQYVLILWAPLRAPARPDFQATAQYVRRCVATVSGVALNSAMMAMMLSGMGVKLAASCPAGTARAE